MTAARNLLEPREFFVSIRRGEANPRRGLLAGPFLDHASALAMVDRAKAAACKADAWADFDAFGTCSLPAGSGRVGVLNGLLGL